MPGLATITLNQHLGSTVRRYINCCWREQHRTLSSQKPPHLGKRLDETTEAIYGKLRLCKIMGGLWYQNDHGR